MIIYEVKSIDIQKDSGFIILWLDDVATHDKLPDGQAPRCVYVSNQYCIYPLDNNSVKIEK